MAEGRLEEALVVLKEGAKTNRKTLPPDSELREMMEKFRSQVKKMRLSSKSTKTFWNSNCISLSKYIQLCLDE